MSTAREPLLPGLEEWRKERKRLARRARGGDVEALRKWRKSNPEKVKQQQRRAIQKRQQRMRTDPAFVEKIRENDRKRSKTPEFRATRRAYYRKNKEKLKALHRLRYRTNEEYRKSVLEAHKTPEYKARRKAYRKLPHVGIKEREYQTAYKARPEVAKHRKAYYRKTEVIINRRRSQLRARRFISDSYCRRRLKLQGAAITPEAIEAKRQELFLNRQQHLNETMQAVQLLKQYGNRD